MARRKASFRNQLYRAARHFGNLDHEAAAGKRPGSTASGSGERVVRRKAYRPTSVWTGRVLRSIKF